MVIAFQNKYGIDATGVVDANTWKAIREAYAQSVAVVPTICLCNVNEFYPGRDLSLGMTGEDIVNLQKFLYLICEKRIDIPGVVVNGNYDRLTEESVLAIQKDNQLPVNGVVGPATWNRIVELSKGN